MSLNIINANQPSWQTVTVKTHVPHALHALDEIAHNLWWTWNEEGINLFDSLDHQLWHEVRKNPIAMLASLSYKRLKAMSEDPEVMQRVETTYRHFRDYIDTPRRTDRPSVAYFCMEYGLNRILKIYSGGLGILAGDYIKEASDSNVDMVAVGFLYRYGYFSQSLSTDGQQIAGYEAQDFERLPIEKVLDEGGRQIIIDVPFPGYTVHAALWRAAVGRVSLYLLDTDLESNSEWDRSITHTLYGGDWENRMKQEYLLGIGGVLTLQRLGLHPQVYHCNEGHAAFCNVQRLMDYTASGYSFAEALELVRASSLYTVHTPVPAGHDYFDAGLLDKYLHDVPQRLGITWEEFIGLGRQNPADTNERFCMSTFLCKTCQEVNGVSWLHGKVSQQMFKGIWPGYFPDETTREHTTLSHDEYYQQYNAHPAESHVSYVTNGVHYSTWAASEWKALHRKYFGQDYLDHLADAQMWRHIYDVPDTEIWQTRVALKQRLTKYIRKRFRATWLKNNGDPSSVVNLLEKINPDALLIGFARRFATYKRAHLLFSDLDRLNKIVNNPDYPVQFLFAGKAHPADGAGQGLIKMIYEISQRPEFLGKIIFLEDYDMELALRLVSGVDIWMNLPTRPLEASGTSGEKALMNGVLNFSVLDGWWYEGYREGAGWALTDKRTYQEQSHQDRLDASTIYSMLEQEVIPLYYAREGKTYSEGWVRAMKNSIAHIAPHYTMRRQIDDYYERFYTPLARRFALLNADNAKMARDIAAWKHQVAEKWNDIHVVDSQRSLETADGSLVSDKSFHVTHIVDECGLNDAIGIDLVCITKDKNGKDILYNAFPMQVTKQEGNLYTFELHTSIDIAGTFRYAYRMYPKHPDLPNRQDFCFVKWFN